MKVSVEKKKKKTHFLFTTSSFLRGKSPLPPFTAPPSPPRTLPFPGSQAASTSLSLSLLSTQTASYRLLINRVPPIFLPSLAAQTLHTNNIRHIADQNCQSAAASRSHQNDNSLIPHLLAPRQQQPGVTCRAVPFPPHDHGETL